MFIIESRTIHPDTHRRAQSLVNNAKDRLGSLLAQAYEHASLNRTYLKDKCLYARANANSSDAAKLDEGTQQRIDAGVALTIVIHQGAQTLLELFAFIA